MTITTIDDVFSISGPITTEDVANLKQQGVTTLICTRYDNEENGQLSSEEMASIAQAHDLAHVNVPVKSGQYSEQDIGAFWQAFKTAQGKVHSYCRTGTRASHLWALGQAQHGAAKQGLLTLLENKGINVDAIR